METRPNKREERRRAKEAFLPPKKSHFHYFALRPLENDKGVHFSIGNGRRRSFDGANLKKRSISIEKNKRLISLTFTQFPPILLMYALRISGKNTGWRPEKAGHNAPVSELSAMVKYRPTVNQTN